MEKLVLLSLTLVTCFIYLVTGKSNQELQLHCSWTDVPHLVWRDSSLSTVWKKPLHSSKCFFRACLYLCLKITPICLWLGKWLLLFMLNCLFYCYLILPNHHHPLTPPCELWYAIGKGLGWGLYYLISTFSLAQGDWSLADTLCIIITQDNNRRFYRLAGIYRANYK